MKIIQILLPLALFLALFSSCQKDDCQPTSKVDENGLTKDITDLVPQYILDEMERLNMPIHGGGTPPQLSGTFLADPFVLESSSLSTDVPGTQINPYLVTFYEQDNDQLNVKVDYKNGVEVGTGLGGFIVGEGSRFTAFVELNVEANSGKAKVVSVLSGTMGASGITDFYNASFMIKIYSDPNNYFKLPEGKGRVFYDTDGFSPRQ